MATIEERLARIEKKLFGAKEHINTGIRGGVPLEE